eukprot:COSAG05_NODE_1438_length_4885_cov_3.395529_4_plen_38_part_00
MYASAYTQYCATVIMLLSQAIIIIIIAISDAECEALQ